MDKKFKIPPKSIKELTAPKILIGRLKGLIGEKFILTGKTRTDGSRVRKLVAETLDKFPLPKEAKTNEYEILPPNKKGVPKITREFIDTYVVTSIAFRKYICNAMLNNYFIQFIFPSEYNRVHIHFV